MRKEYKSSLVGWVVVLLCSFFAWLLKDLVAALLVFGLFFSIWAIVSVAVFMDSTNEKSWIFRFLTKYLDEKPEEINLCSISGFLFFAVSFTIVELVMIAFVMTIVNVSSIIAEASVIKLKHKPFSGEGPSWTVEKRDYLYFGEKKRTLGNIIEIMFLCFIICAVVYAGAGVLIALLSDVFSIQGYGDELSRTTFFVYMAALVFVPLICYFIYRKANWSEIYRSITDIVYAIHKNVCIIKRFNSQDRMDESSEEELADILERENKLNRN